ncbi:hypothetical protein HGRIS_005329 [Hohenbuehelia grisea]|uniref:Ferric reductase NAD binding domain-containing protein n=1 Tax=Hohenbuehelia grisea TaxID=104357 RepID=A0ABR3JF65_9AGAR
MKKASLEDAPEMVFYIRAHGGLTRDLFHSVESGLQERTLSVHVDGPYGGLVEDVPALYETLVFVAGGSGIAACLPWIQHAVARVEKGGAIVRAIHLIWVVREPAHLQWISNELDSITRRHPTLLQLHLFVTDKALSGVKVVPDDDSDGTPASSVELDLGPVQNGRPYLPELIPSLLSSSRRVLIFGCGPEGMRTDLCNAAAAAQRRVLAGEADVITLHTEFFGW